MPPYRKSDDDQVTHPALARALELCESLVEWAHPDRTTVEQLLAWTKRSADPWTGSQLSMGGFPFEFTFTTDSSDVRYCLEVAEPRSDPRRRLGQTADAISRLTMSRPDGHIMRRLQRIQSSASLKYGTWCGGRHQEGQRRFKLYAEVPVENRNLAEAWASSLFGDLPEVVRPHSRVVMIGCDVPTGSLEFYYQAWDIPPALLPVLLRRANLESRASAMLTLLQQAHPFSLVGRLPSRDVGFSYSMPLVGGPTAFTMYFVAKAVCGGDARTRSTMLALGPRSKLALYEAMSRPLMQNDRTQSDSRHGMLGLVARPGAPVSLAIGLVPPSPAPC